MLVIEAESTCGGTWARDRLYHGLKSNNLYGSYELPDYRLDGVRYGVSEGQHIPGHVLHRYYTDYAKHFGVFDRVRFNARVLSAEATSSGSWIITTTSSVSDASHSTQARPKFTLTAHKLIVATGLTSQPNMPSFPGAESFTSPVFHARDLCRNASITTTATRAIVVGGGKSAFDVAYAFATSPACTGGVDMLIRPGGNGPVWMSYAHVTPFKRKMEDLVLTRCLTWFSPCVWGDEDGYKTVRWLLQVTSLGSLLVRLLFWAVGMDVLTAVGYDKHPETRKLKPWHDALWADSAIGVWNFDQDFLGLVRQGRVRVHLSEISRLEEQQVVLNDGSILPSVDVVVCATGWKKKDSSLKFINFDTGLAQKGVERAMLVRKADEKIFAKLPMLRNQPKLRPEQIVRRQRAQAARGEQKTSPGPKEDRGDDDGEPLRYYRFIVPSQGIASRNIAFAGRVSPISTAISAHLQGLWIAAFFDGKLARGPPPVLPDGGDGGVVDEILLHTQFIKWRHPCGYGPVVPDMTFDSIAYADLLMNDLGLKVRRKGGSVWREWFEPYKPWDYAGVEEEYRALHGR